MACSCQKISGMKKRHHRVGDPGITEELMPVGLVGGGVIGMHYLKSLIPASLQTSLGTNYGLVVNGIGIAAGLFIPSMVKDPETKSWVKPLAYGAAAQCLYSIFLNNVVKAVPPAVNRTWATYSLAGRQQGMTYALGCVTRPDGTKVYVPVTKPAATTQSPANPNPDNVVMPQRVITPNQMKTQPQQVTNPRSATNIKKVGGSRGGF